LTFIAHFAEGAERSYFYCMHFSFAASANSIRDLCATNGTES